MQGAYALSSAEAELYAMVESVARAKALRNFAVELGFSGLDNVVTLGMDTSAAKSFVCRRGLGKMRDWEIRDLWLQNEVRNDRLVFRKISGDRNPADLMTKALPLADIKRKLAEINIKLVDKSLKPVLVDLPMYYLWIVLPYLLVFLVIHVDLLQLLCSK